MSIHIQKQIKDNANEMRSYVRDLYKWEDGHDEIEKQRKVDAKKLRKMKKLQKKQQMKARESQRKQEEQELRDEIERIQNEKEEEARGQTGKQEPDNNQKNETGPSRTPLRRDENTIKGYYDNWSKFDVVSPFSTFSPERTRSWTRSTAAMGWAAVLVRKAR